MENQNPSNPIDSKNELTNQESNPVVISKSEASNNKEANVYNAVVRNDLTVSTNTVLNGNTTIAHNKDFIVGNSTIKTYSQINLVMLDQWLLVKQQELMIE